MSALIDLNRQNDKSWMTRRENYSSIVFWCSSLGEITCFTFYLAKSYFPITKSGETRWERHKTSKIRPVRIVFASAHLEMARTNGIHSNTLETSTSSSQTIDKEDGNSKTSHISLQYKLGRDQRTIFEKDRAKPRNERLITHFSCRLLVDRKIALTKTKQNKQTAKCV